jgi:hypothetical protein
MYPVHTFQFSYNNDTYGMDFESILRRLGWQRKLTSTEDCGIAAEQRADVEPSYLQNGWNNDDVTTPYVAVSTSCPLVVLSGILIPTTTYALSDQSGTSFQRPFQEQRGHEQEQVIPASASSAVSTSTRHEGTLPSAGVTAIREHFPWSITGSRGRPTGHYPMCSQANQLFDEVYGHTARSDNPALCTKRRVRAWYRDVLKKWQKEGHEDMYDGDGDGDGSEADSVESEVTMGGSDEIRDCTEKISVISVMTVVTQINVGRGFIIILNGSRKKRVQKFFSIIHVGGLNNHQN